MFSRILNRMEEGFIALLLVSMTLLVFVQVINRFVFNGSFLWADEVTLHISAWLVLFGASWGVKRGAHIGVDAFVKLMPSGVQRGMGLLAALLALAYCVIIMVGAWEFLGKLIKINIEMEDVPFPKWIAESVLFWGIGLLAFRVAELGWNILRGRAMGFQQASEADEVLREFGVDEEPER